MAYLMKKITIGDITIIEKYYSNRYGSKGKCTRGQNYGKTPENVAKSNARRACMKADAVFNANFGQGSLLLTFTVAPQYKNFSTKEKMKWWRNYMDKCRRAYKKAGIVFKWMKCVETPEGNFHIHAVFSAIDTTLLPKWEYGKIHIEFADDRDYHTYGGYLREQTHVKQHNKGKYTDVKPVQYYSHSRNLIIPEPEITVISNDHWADDPKAPEGYYIFEKKVENWEDEVNGYKHQSYILVKLPDKPKRKPKAAGKGGRR